MERVVSFKKISCRCRYVLSFAAGIVVDGPTWQQDIARSDVGGVWGGEVASKSDLDRI